MTGDVIQKFWPSPNTTIGATYTQWFQDPILPPTIGYSSGMILIDDYGINPDIPTGHTYGITMHGQGYAFPGHHLVDGQEVIGFHFVVYRFDPTDSLWKVKIREPLYVTYPTEVANPTVLFKKTWYFKHPVFFKAGDVLGVEQGYFDPEYRVNVKNKAQTGYSILRGNYALEKSSFSRTNNISTQQKFIMGTGNNLVQFGAMTKGTIDTTTEALGFEPLNRANHDGSNKTFFNSHQQFTANGNVYKIETFNKGAGNFKLKIWRDTGGSNYIQIAESEVISLGIETNILYPTTPLPVLKNDYYAFYCDAGCDIDYGVEGVEPTEPFSYVTGDASGGSAFNLGGPNFSVKCHVGTKGTVELDP